MVRRFSDIVAIFTARIPPQSAIRTALFDSSAAAHSYRPHLFGEKRFPQNQSHWCINNAPHPPKFQFFRLIAGFTARIMAHGDLQTFREGFSHMMIVQNIISISEINNSMFLPPNRHCPTISQIKRNSVRRTPKNIITLANKGQNLQPRRNAGKFCQRATKRVESPRPESR